MLLCASFRMMATCDFGLEYLIPGDYAITCSDSCCNRVRSMLKDRGAFGVIVVLSAGSDVLHIAQIVKL